LTGIGIGTAFALLLLLMVVVVLVRLFSVQVLKIDRQSPAVKPEATEQDREKALAAAISVVALRATTRGADSPAGDG